MATRRNAMHPQSEGDDHLFDGDAGSLIDAGAGNDTVLGRGGDDTLLGGDGNDRLDGNAGADSLDGGAGDDVLYGHQDADILQGGAGNDSLFGSDGHDQLFGGGGNDLLIYTGPGSSGLAGGGGSDTMVGGDGDDRFYADYEYGGPEHDGAGDINHAFGGAGTDIYTARDGLNRFNGGSGTDWMWYRHAAGPVDVWLALSGAQANGDVLANVEHVLGGIHADRLRGNALDNSLNGFSGNDTLQGGGGRDVLVGGPGADRFAYVFASDAAISTALEVIQDFSRDQGDLIDLSRIDANEGVAGNQAFVFIGDAAFSSTNASGQLRYSAGTLYASVDADAAAEFAITFWNPTGLIASDFVL